MRAGRGEGFPPEGWAEPAPWRPWRRAIQEEQGEPAVSLADVQAVIESAKARGTGPLEAFLRKRAPGFPEEKLQEATSLCLEIIESVPVLLARARQEARERGMMREVQPILEHAERYFLTPVDLIPEMTQGLAGLLDDTYLVLKVLSELERGPRAFLGFELEHPLRFLRSLMGEELSRRLDDLAQAAKHEISHHLAAVWRHPALEA